MSSSTHEKVVIIGAGAAGLTAAIYTARANLSPVILAGLQPGGQMTITTDVENYPGFADVIQGPWLMTEMQQQAENVGARVVYDIVTALDAATRPFRLTLDSGDVMTADAVIVATGAQARWLGLDSEQAFNGRGVSACATCDGFFYRERDVAVIGGGIGGEGVLHREAADADEIIRVGDALITIPYRDDHLRRDLERGQPHPHHKGLIH